MLAYWRRRKVFVAVAVPVLAATLLFAVLWPPTYRSTATILIEQQEMPQDLVRSVITTYADQRVQVISQRVMTSQNLMTLIDRYNLYPVKRDRLPREELLDTMRNDIDLKMISASVIDPRSGQPTHATIAFSVSYDSRSPSVALKVANELSTLYLNENLTTRAQQSRQTATFFTEEAALQKEKIAALDQKLADFKKKHEAELPEFVLQNVGLEDRTRLSLQEVEDHIGALDSQIVLLRAQLSQISPTAQVFKENGERVFGAADQLKALRARLAGLKGRYAPDHPDVVSAERQIAGLEQEVATGDDSANLVRKLSEARAQLAAAAKRYSADHPDVVRLQREVKTLEGEIQASPAGTVDSVAVEHPDNPAYVQLKSELNAIATQRESEVRKQAELQNRLNELGRHLSGSPEVEREYREINRDLEAAQYQYGTILAKQSEAQIAVNLETEQKGEKFTMIEAPQPPEKPVSPNRTLILGIGLVLSLGLGIGAVLGSEALDASVRGPKDVRELLQVAPLASIPVVVTRRERARRLRMLRYSWGGGIAALVIAAVMAHFLVAPLDVLWLALLRRFGV
jgi:uncharacterized protein involved in exopolysaccharide biosynthesis